MVIRFLSVGLVVGIAACNSGVEYDSIESELEAGAPPTPIYTRVRVDDVTGDNTPLVVMGTNANCTAGAPCFIADPDADSYKNDEFERPTGQGAAAVNYLPSIDIVSGETGADANWLFYRFNLYGPQPGQMTGSSGALPHFYGIECNFDNDPQGDAIFEIDQPSLNVGGNWGTTGLYARTDQNETMGGPRPLLPDGPGAAGGGYEHKMFDNGQNTANGKPGGSTAMQARVVGDSVEIAVYRPFLQALTNQQITSFAFRPYAAVNSVLTSELYMHDDKNRIQMGSPYPWLTKTGAPAVCPNGSSGDDNATATQVEALESGTNVDTGIPNPCYATGGIYQRDNAGTVSELGDKDDLAVKVDLVLDKTDAPDPATFGDQIIYTLAVTNTQPATVTNAIVVDVLPATVTYLSSSPNCTYTAATRTVRCAFATVGPNATVTAQVTVRPDALGVIANSATVSSDGEEKTPNNNTDSTTTTVLAACGNSIVNVGEGCDDGNTMNGDGCESDCKLPDGSGCTDDTQCHSGVCDPNSHICEPANTCGNGHVEGSEGCDDGNNTSGDGCEANCKLPDGAPCTSDGQCNSNTCDPNSNTCEPADTCGNGHVEGLEICDDGNTMSGDTCESDCTLPDGSSCTGDNQCHSGTCDPNSNTCEPNNTCGNGHLETGEVCDDGNNTNGDGCESDCKLTDGTGCTSDDQCHSGTCDPNSDVCEPHDVCGNGHLETGEVCDDGNNTDGDGCESDCKLPDGSSCTSDDQCHSGVCDPTSDVCEPADTCGNGKTEAGETCDDGGTTGGDGCDATCQSELDTDGDGVFDVVDIDDDNDGILDATEGTADTDGDGAADAVDLDSDNDGMPDATEAHHAYPDNDGDFLADCPTKSYGVNGFCDALETAVDSGTAMSPTPLDFDNDTVPDYRDLDTDNDGISDLHEGGSACADANDDGICDGTSDLDHDGIAITVDFFVGFGNVGGHTPTDTDHDGAPDCKDLDSDADGIFDIQESKNAFLDVTLVNGIIDATSDKDGDGIRDVADDSDLDHLADSDDVDPPKFGGLHDSRIWSDDDGTPDFQDPDADGDNVDDGDDNCRIDVNPDQADTDGDGIGDKCDVEDGRTWGVQGAACGCSSSQQSPAGLLLILGALGIVIGRRRRRAAQAAAVAMLAVPTIASAQVVNGDFSTERFQLASDREGILDVESGSVQKHLSLGLGLWFGYENDPLILNRTDNGTMHVGSLVSDQISGELVGSLGLLDRLQIGVAVPLVLTQSDSIPTGGTTPTAPSQSFAVGDLRFIPKVRLVKQSDFGADVSVWMALTAPTSSGQGFTGDAGFTAAPAVAVSRTFDNGLRTAFNLGYRTRARQMSLDLEVNDEVFAGLGAAKQFGDIEVDGGFAFATAANNMFGAFNRNYAELKVGGSYDFTGPLLGFAAMGAGLSEGYGTPDWRLLVGVRVDREKPEEKAAPLPPPPPPVCTVDCPDMDNDKDGIKNADDQCRNDPEDFDQFEDADGCPDTDNDKDSILDAADKCPNDAEDMDAFEDEDGCPETDNDQDTVLDAQDKCPLQAGAPENEGCPWPDTDGDGIIDKFDNCPKWKGTAEHQGCNVKQLVKITESKLELYETTFFATNKAVIQKRSYKLLNNVAEVIKNHTDLKISIEGHTDSQGSDAFNLKLSQMRAQAVMAYLVKRGVDPARLAAQGYGEDRPIADNKTAKGRAQNRRVEFMASRIIETTTTTVVPAPDPTTATPAQP
jgi:uncharacterized repeat protein (TIGR01451 family)/MYXO-CTERM domain-containing protein